MKRTKINWDNFLKVTNSKGTRIEGALCKDCKNMIKTVTSHRLQAHRKCCPAKAYANYNDDDDVDVDDELQDDAELRNILDQDLAKFFFSASIPFIQVENVHLKQFIRRIQTFNADYKPPCRTTLASTVLHKVHDSIVTNKKNFLDGTDGVLLVDGWRNNSTNRKYLVFSIRNINTTQTFLTFFDTSIEREDGESLRDRINEAIRIAKDKYNCNIYAIISDNDSKIVLGAKLAKEATLIRSTCSSHSGNLLVKLFVTKELLDSLRNIINTFREPKLESLLLAKNGSELQNFPDTRFCYLRDTCRSILRNFKHLKELSLVRDAFVDKKVTETLLDDQFKTQLTTIVDNLDPICVLINNCQHPKCNVADATEQWLSLELPTNQYNNQISERIKKAVHPVGYAANLLHHTYKGQRMNEEQRNIANVFLNGYLNEQAKLELIEYLGNGHSYKLYAENIRDPIAFWLHVKQQKIFSNLAVAAIKLLIIPGSTALLEGLFSNWTYVHNVYRNRLGHVKSSHLLDIYYSLKNDLYNEDLINEIMLIEDDDEKQVRKGKSVKVNDLMLVEDDSEQQVFKGELVKVQSNLDNTNNSNSPLVGTVVADPELWC